MDSGYQNLNANCKFILKDEDSLEKTLEYLISNHSNLVKKKVCIVSIIGKSSFGCKACKAAIIDEALGNTIFRLKFCQHKKINSDNFCDVEGFVDSQNKVIFLHLLSHFDTDVLAHIVNINHSLKSKDNFQLFTNISYNTARILLLLFIISHIIVIVNPVPQFDLNYLHLFRLLNSIRSKTQPFVTEILQEFPNISNHWVYNGRPCSPRVLFFFEAYENHLRNQILKLGKHKLEHQLEDQIYRFLRKSRIITNICANSLFAICSQSHFVYISTSDPTIRDAQNFFLSLLEKYCSSKTETETKLESNSQSFYYFLFSHINIALTKGFDDNFGRHTFFFELPTVSDFFEVLIKLKKFFLSKDDDSNSAFSHLRTALDINRRFSENRCSKVMPMALNIYQEGLPTHYTLDLHSRKLSQALHVFTAQSRGPALYTFAQKLKEECDAYWQNGRQMCEVTSLTNNNCINPVHKVNSEDENTLEDDMCRTKSDSNQLPIMPHCSGVMITSACDCGKRQATRNDPFTVKAANYDFYCLIANKCNCADLERIEFPVFQQGTSDAKPAKMLRVLDLIENVNLSQNECNFESQPESLLTNLSQEINPSPEVMFKLNHSPRHDEVENSQVDNELETLKSLNTLKENSKELSKPKSSISNESECDYWESDEEEEVISEDNKNKDVQIIIKDDAQTSNYTSHHSTTEYLPRMLHSLSKPGLLPKFSSWSLVCLGASSLYSHSAGIQDQPGFISGTNFLLPWDVTVKLEHSDNLPPLWEGKRPPGIKNKKVLKDGTQFTVKIFLGVEYECPRGHRFMSNKPSSVLKANNKSNANSIASNDMPLYMPCVCSRSGKELFAQLMRIHVVTPKAPVNVTLNPKVQPAPPPCPIFYPGTSEPVKLSQSTYWVLRLPFIYEGDHVIYTPFKDRLEMCRLLKGTYGISDYIYKPKN